MTRDEAVANSLCYSVQEPCDEGHAKLFLAELANHGFAVVPLEATDAVCDAARDAADDGRWSDEYVGNIYRAMVYAAKEPGK